MALRVFQRRLASSGILNNISDSIGNTPLVRLRRVVPGDLDAEILLKMESENPLKSVKDRLGLALINDGLKRGELTPDTHVIEPTSGNTGIALAFLCADRGYKLTLTMPESMSLERRALLIQFGANIVLTPREKGMSGALAAAKELCEAEIAAGRKAFIPGQFTNPANPQIHEDTTGPEIWRDTDGKIDAIVAGVGTGGTITGVTRYIKKQNPDFKAIAVEPSASPVISGGSPGPHMIQGIGAGFIPDTLDTSLLDGVEQISNEESFEMARRLAKEEGILAGISAGGNVAAAIRVAQRPEFKGKRIVTVCCSFGERYLSTPLFTKEA
eukprot:TRINITY_DN462_c0_g1_i3.p1 TRINITY_DN462_c0_g1~~TRINITY_DN462_c0_g1_i3.p1  ORF type:complete len:341 (+),score=121.16 TRINITY_DN462_c0_g1_i3:43-1023(+)